MFNYVIGQRLTMFSMGIIVCIGLIGMFQGKTFLSMFNIGVSLAVAAIPEGLPICVAVTLALGVMRMAQKNAIVKKLPAVEALGCANYICTDKTGTLTENKMSVVSIYCPVMEDLVSVNSIPSSISVDATSSASGSKIDLLALDNSVKLAANEILYNGLPIPAVSIPCISKLLEAACLCNNAILTDSITITGQPTEGALLIAAHRLGIQDRRSQLSRVKEIQFTSETKCMEVIYERLESNKISQVHYMKGALEMILPQCVTYIDNNGELILLSVSAKERVFQHAQEMAEQGLRVLAVAFGDTHNQLTLGGIIGIMDPLRKGVEEAVYRMTSSGAKVMMITGDAEGTAVSIAKYSGVYKHGETHCRILSGAEIEDLSKSGDQALAAIIEDVVVCYRTSPRHKLSIVRALQSLGHVVAMTGILIYTNSS